MPLLDIVGVSSSNKSFYSCFVFLNKENVEDYIWALEIFLEMIGPSSQPLVMVSDRNTTLMKAIACVFPRTTHLLCIWHIQKNIVAKCKNQFTNDEDWDMFLSTWNAVMYAETEASFYEAWHLIELLYKEKHIIQFYLKETWLPYKEKFVTAWIDTYPHFGNRVSSRAEGAHAKLKGYLQVSTGDFAQVASKICLAIENEFQEINTTLESERIRIPHRCRILQFKFLYSCVSRFALGLLYKQYKMVKSGTFKAECSGHFAATMGLPCAHMMNRSKETSLLLDSINSQWRVDKIFLTACDGTEMQNEENGIVGLCDKLLDRYQEAPIFEKKDIEEKLCSLLHALRPVILEPNVQISKGRPRGSLKKNKRKEPISSTRREPSEFELVEASMDKKNKQKVAQTSESLPEIGVLNSMDAYHESNLFGIDMNSYIPSYCPFSPYSL
ncbi:uncharacterized protein LOC141601165 [Silene latifolia]|uniref:uncharacterized protein LOC141601165 n=1 Tax=Silene latifolia TaxID=37657 RepID=UPI003D788171